GHTFTLQLVASNTAYNVQRSGGAVTFSKVRVELPTVGGATSPSACTSRRAFTVHVRRRFRRRLRSARVLVGGRVVAHGAPARLDLRGRPGGVVTVRIVVRLRGHRHAVVDTRRYRLCQKRR